MNEPLRLTPATRLRSERTSAYNGGLQCILDGINHRMRDEVSRGAVATYIPQLAGVSSQHFGIAVALNSGDILTAGDVDDAFSIQSISKVFTLTLAFAKVGDSIWNRVGREPSGGPFNSIIQLDSEKGIPRNPFINAGAIAVSDILLAGGRPKNIINQILRFVREITADDTVSIDAAVADSEHATAFRNAAIANYMRDLGSLEHDPDEVLDVYVQHCAIALNCRQLATSGRYLAHGGFDPATGNSVLSLKQTGIVNTLMLMCGLYDKSGDFAFRVGLPAKSGVGGGILAIVPGIASVAVWCPGLDQSGNSLLGARALQSLSEQMSWSIFTPHPEIDLEQLRAS